MNLDGPNLLWLVGALVLAVSALTAQRPSLGAVLRSLLGWAVVLGIVALVMTHRPQVEALVEGAAERLGVGEQQATGDTVRIAMGADGHFWARATINGTPKRLLVDSGATITALSPQTARAAGIAVGNAGFPVMLTTANGTITAERGTARSVKVGGIATRELGVVVSPNFAGVDVLGMNFLSRLGSWRVEGRTLILVPKRAAGPVKAKS